MTPSSAPRPPSSLRALALLGLTLLSCVGRHVIPPRAAEEVSRGYRHLAAGDPERAEVAFTHALAFDPDLPEAENGLGIVARLAGDLDRARRHLERAVRLRPSFAEGHANLGELHLAAGRPIEAEQALRAALKIDPDLGDARLNLARALLRRGLSARSAAERSALFARSRREYLHLLEGVPASADAEHDLGFMDFVEGRYARAAGAYGRAARLAPGSPQAEHGLCISLVRLGRCAEAAAACERCLAADPGSERCARSLAGARACDPGPD